MLEIDIEAVSKHKDWMEYERGILMWPKSILHPLLDDKNLPLIFGRPMNSAIEVSIALISLSLLANTHFNPFI